MKLMTVSILLLNFINLMNTMAHDDEDVFCVFDIIVECKLGGTWCYELNIFSKRLIKNEWSTASPIMCTENTMSGLRLQAKFTQPFLMGDYIQPRIRTMHNCTQGGTVIPFDYDTKWLKRDSVLNYMNVTIDITKREKHYGIGTWYFRDSPKYIGRPKDQIGLHRLQKHLNLSAPKKRKSMVSTDGQNWMEVETMIEDHVIVNLLNNTSPEDSSGESNVTTMSISQEPNSTILTDLELLPTNPVVVSEVVTNGSVSIILQHEPTESIEEDDVVTNQTSAEPEISTVDPGVIKSVPVVEATLPVEKDVPATNETLVASETSTVYPAEPVVEDISVINETVTTPETSTTIKPISVSTEPVFTTPKPTFPVTSTPAIVTTEPTTTRQTFSSPKPETEAENLLLTLLTPNFN